MNRKTVCSNNPGTFILNAEKAGCVCARVSKCFELPVRVNAPMESSKKLELDGQCVNSHEHGNTDDA